MEKMNWSMATDVPISWFMGVFASAYTIFYGRDRYHPYMEDLGYVMENLAHTIMDYSDIVENIYFVGDVCYLHIYPDNEDVLPFWEWFRRSLKQVDGFPFEDELSHSFVATMSFIYWQMSSKDMVDGLRKLSYNESFMHAKYRKMRFLEVPLMKMKMMIDSLLKPMNSKN